MESNEKAMSRRERFLDQVKQRLTNKVNNENINRLDLSLSCDF